MAWAVVLISEHNGMKLRDYSGDRIGQAPPACCRARSAAFRLSSHVGGFSPAKPGLFAVARLRFHRLNERPHQIEPPKDNGAFPFERRLTRGDLEALKTGARRDFALGEVVGFKRQPRCCRRAWRGQYQTRG